MAVSKRLRFEIFRRDNHTCRYCGASAPDVALEPDHVVPKALGGTDEPSNLVTACHACNSGKTSIVPGADLVEDVAQDALRWSKAMDKAAELHRRQAADLTSTVETFGEIWADRWCGHWYEACLEPDAGWHYRDDPEVLYPWVVKRVTADGEVTSGRLFHTAAEAHQHARELTNGLVPPRPKDWTAAARQWIRAGITPVDFDQLVTEVITDRDYVQWDRKWAYTAGCCWGLIRQRQATARALLAAEEES